MAQAHEFIFGSLIFIVFLLAVESFAGVGMITGNPNLTIAVPDCSNVTLGIVGCAGLWGNFLISISTINSSFALLNILITIIIIVDIFIFLSEVIT